MDDVRFYAVLFVLGAVGMFLRARGRKRVTTAPPTPAMPLHADGSACTGSGCHNIEHAS